MASVFLDFKEAQRVGSGPRLAAALNPIAPAEEPSRLRDFYHFASPASVYSGLRYYLFHDNGPRLSKQEQTAWTDIFVAFWNAVAELVKFDESPPRGSWIKAFDLWKEVANVLIKGYSSGGLQAWTLPCLYTVGKYLRIFAIRADAEIETEDAGGVSSFQDDFEFDKSAKLEDAARTINRMFILCLSDRYGPLCSDCFRLANRDRAPLENSRKWGIYDTTNMMFKTYFKVRNSSIYWGCILTALVAQFHRPLQESTPRS